MVIGSALRPITPATAAGMPRGGLTAWIRREVVQRSAWLDDQQVLSGGFALSQLVLGATNVNLSVFVVAQLEMRQRRGWPAHHRS